MSRITRIKWHRFNCKFCGKGNVRPGGGYWRDGHIAPKFCNTVCYGKSMRKAQRHASGYVLLTVDGEKGARRVFEHVFKMEKKLDRRLKKNETVHHKNGVKVDNRLRNLELWESGHPSGQRPKDLEKDAVQRLRRLGYLVVHPSEFK
jgi:hypothetical protein